MRFGRMRARIRSVLNVVLEPLLLVRFFLGCAVIVLTMQQGHNKLCIVKFNFLYKHVHYDDHTGYM